MLSISRVQFYSLSSQWSKIINIHVNAITKHGSIEWHKHFLLSRVPIPASITPYVVIVTTSSRYQKRAIYFVVDEDIVEIALFSLRPNTSQQMYVHKHTTCCDWCWSWENFRLNQVKKSRNWKQWESWRCFEKGVIPTPTVKWTKTSTTVTIQVKYFLHEQQDQYKESVYIVSW